jgi:surfeit locus 1 family protein
MNGSRAQGRLIVQLFKLLLLALAVAALLGLALWQYHRGREKEVLAQHYASAMLAPPALLDRAYAAAHTPGVTMVPVHVRGTYLADRQMLLDSQSHGDQPGYHVWTPLRTEDGALVVIDRGWIPHSLRKSFTSPPGAAVDVRGFWRRLPSPAIRLGADNCSGKNWPRVVEWPTAKDLACLLGETPVAGVVDLDPRAPDGFVRNWNPVQEFPPERHFAYAVQWLLLAVTLLVLSLRFMYKRSR